MKEKYWLFILSLCIRLSASGQQREILQATLSDTANLGRKFPVADTLCPFKVPTKPGIAKALSLSKAEIKEIARASRQSPGEKLDVYSAGGAAPVSGAAYYKALQTGDSASLAYIEAHKPFYVFSEPVLFSAGNKAIIDVDLVGRYGYTFLLLKKGDKWHIVGRYVRWIV